MNNKVTLDGNQAAAYATYAFTEVASIFPITPSTPIAETVEEWSAHGKKNIFGHEVKVIEMQSEAGAAATMRGAMQSGSLASTFTASQGLLLMIPSLYKMAGELLPGVLHVTARSIATHALSIFGDHQDVMACRQTGVALLASSNVQEVLDFGTIAHLAAIKSRIPFIHFFDGFRTSHEYQKIKMINQEELPKLVDMQAVLDFRKRALNPEHPVIRGTTQNPDIYFQQREGANRFYNKLVEDLQYYIVKFAELTGRNYQLYEYYGATDAENIIVAMGSVCETIEETVDYLIKNGEKVGAIKVHLYRPFAEKLFIEQIPRTVKKIAVLDRTKEPGAPGEPLYLDVVKALKDGDITVVGGRYGLSSKDTRPSQIISVFNNLKEDLPKDRFTIGIVDDVTNTSLQEASDIDTTPEGTISCKIWGLGSDGTVGANKTAIQIIGDKTDLEVQGYFSYDSKKSGGTTVSHLRFGKNPIRSTYLVYNADYIACHNRSFVYQYDLIKGIKKGGTFVLVCPWNKKELKANLPPNLKRELAEKNISFYTIDAMKIASEAGLGNRINMIMQAVFFKLANVIPYEEALVYLKDSVRKMYGKKGEDIVKKNQEALDKAIDTLVMVEFPKSWADAKDDKKEDTSHLHFIGKIQIPMARLEGDDLPVSAFEGMEDGTFPPGTTAYEKRGIAPTIPEWDMEKCIQCNQCSYICPHATVRPYLLNSEEVAIKPKSFETKQAIGSELKDYQYRIQISPLDCTGCGNCADICPAKGKALIMQEAQGQIKSQAKNWEYAITISQKENAVSDKNIKASQFVKPYLEFNGACPGCGESPYIKLLTQLFGDRMLISNATGCSSIWGASAPSTAYTRDVNGRGPAWINPLFEDAAEFALGLEVGARLNFQKLIYLGKEIINTNVDERIKNSIIEWMDTINDIERSKISSEALIKELENEIIDPSNKYLAEFLELKDYLVRKSVWAIGGDGWSYDIDYGGLDHVISTGENVNIFVMDTEVYSNTGGQCSKATPTGAVAKLASTGKKQRKKDLGLMAMTYGDVYVAQIAMGADMNQTLKAIVEAERFNGPSLIIAYSPCVNHGIKSGMGTSVREGKRAVESGYWHLYRYNPDLKKEGKNPFILDSKEPKSDFDEFLQGEIRYSQINRIFPESALELRENAKKFAMERYSRYKKMSKEEKYEYPNRER